MSLNFVLNQEFTKKGKQIYIASDGQTLHCVAVKKQRQTQQSVMRNRGGGHRGRGMLRKLPQGQSHRQKPCHYGTPLCVNLFLYVCVCVGGM